MTTYRPTRYRPDGWDEHDAPDPIGAPHHPAVDPDNDIPPWAQTARQDSYDRTIYGDTE